MAFSSGNLVSCRAAILMFLSFRTPSVCLSFPVLIRELILIVARYVMFLFLLVLTGSHEVVGPPESDDLHAPS